MTTKPSHNIKTQAEAILAFARDLEAQLHLDETSKNFNLSENVSRTLEKHLGHLPLLREVPPAAVRRQLDDQGTRVWNMCLERMTANQDNTDKTKLLCKALAYGMLEAAAPKTSQGNYRSLELALKTINICIDQGLLDLSQKITETAATRLDMIEKANIDTDTLKVRKFTTEYYVLRIYLSAKQGRLDIADHLFSKISEIRTTEEQMCIVDVCYKIGHHLLLSCADPGTAITWLERAMGALGPSSRAANEESNQFAKDRKLLILHALARANIRSCGGSRSRFHEVLGMLKAEYDAAFSVLLIQLEALTRGELNKQEYFETLTSALENLDFNDMKFDIMYHYIKKLGHISSKLFIEVSTQLLYLHLYHLATTLVSLNSPELAKQAVDKLNEYSWTHLSEEATSASLILIWKYIDTAISHGSTLLAEEWCRFILERDLFRMTPDTTAKFFRKWINCVMENYNPSAASTIFNQVPRECKACPMTLYSLYKLALVADDASLACFYFESLCILEANPNYISSCISEALKLDKINLAIKALKQLVSSSEDNFEKLQISMLFQYVLCHIREKLSSSTDSTELQSQTISSLKLALKAETSKVFSPDEFRWFSKESYNIALELHKSSPLESVITILNLSMKFADLSQQVLGSDHHLLCNFLKSTRLISGARKEKCPLKKKTYYEESLHPLTHFQRTYLQSPQETWTSKYRTILSFTFEAAVSLQNWEIVSNAIEKSAAIVDPNLSCVFLDCILHSDASSTCIAQVVKQMIRTFHGSPSPSFNTSTFKFDESLPRYFRCLFVLSIDAAEYALAESVLDQVLAFARGSPETRLSCYPEEEVQWMATVSFNRSVDFFLESKDEDFRRWAAKAIALAELVGELAGLLRRNLLKLLKNNSGAKDI